MKKNIYKSKYSKSYASLCEAHWRLVEGKKLPPKLDKIGEKIFKLILEFEKAFMSVSK